MFAVADRVAEEPFVTTKVVAVPGTKVPEPEVVVTSVTPLLPPVIVRITLPPEVLSMKDVVVVLSVSMTTVIGDMVPREEKSPPQPSKT